MNNLSREKMSFINRTTPITPKEYQENLSINTSVNSDESQKSIEQNNYYVNEVCSNLFKAIIPEYYTTAHSVDTFVKTHFIRIKTKRNEAEKNSSYLMQLYQYNKELHGILHLCKGNENRAFYEFINYSKLISGAFNGNNKLVNLSGYRLFYLSGNNFLLLKTEIEMINSRSIRNYRANVYHDLQGIFNWGIGYKVNIMLIEYILTDEYVTDKDAKEAEYNIKNNYTKINDLYSTDEHNKLYGKDLSSANLYMSLYSLVDFPLINMGMINDMMLKRKKEYLTEKKSNEKKNIEKKINEKLSH